MTNVPEKNCLVQHTFFQLHPRTSLYDFFGTPLDDKSIIKCPIYIVNSVGGNILSPIRHEKYEHSYDMLRWKKNSDERLKNPGDLPSFRFLAAILVSLRLGPWVVLESQWSLSSTIWNKHFNPDEYFSRDWVEVRSVGGGGFNLEKEYILK